MGKYLETYIIVSEKKWHDSLIEDLNVLYPANWVRIQSSNDFNEEYIDSLSPVKIFIPHWSKIIPESIFKAWECIVFHMTDLPYGRGGSPLQNLIVRGERSTKIAAIKVESGIDTGPIYIKKDLNLDGTAFDIFERSTPIIKEMILEIIKLNIIPTKQNGEVLVFNRRKEHESNIESLNTCHKIYDYIRMLDCEGYPKAFLENNSIKFEFSNAKFDKEKNQIVANVRIVQK